MFLLYFYGSAAGRKQASLNRPEPSKCTIRMKQSAVSRQLSDLSNILKNNLSDKKSAAQFK
ncbi:MAG: hypothetical protein DRH04_05565 [Deltaproteobacteria bacterium]|nr:MAG: hypothetical protein DRH04_05565 [Deltaproteobacteria bacterium]